MMYAASTDTHGYVASPSPILSLPKEVLQHIVEHCGNGGVADLRSTCKALSRTAMPRRICISDSFTRDELRLSSQLCSRWSEASTIIINVTPLQQAPERYISEYVEQTLRILDRRLCTQLVHWTQLQTVLAPLNHQLVATFVAACPQLRSVVLRSGCYGRVDCTTPRRTINGIDDWEPYREATQEEFMRQLVHPDHVASSLNLLARCSTLRSLHLHVPDLPELMRLFSSLTQLSRLACTMMADAAISDTWQLPELPQLKHLSMNLSSSNDMFPFETTLKPASLAGCSNLTHLTGALPPPPLPPFPPALPPPTPPPQLLPMLQRLHAPNLTLGDDMARALSHCQHLQHLLVHNLSLTHQHTTPLPSLHTLQLDCLSTCGPPLAAIAPELRLLEILHLPSQEFPAEFTVHRATNPEESPFSSCLNHPTVTALRLPMVVFSDKWHNGSQHLNVSGHVNTGSGGSGHVHSSGSGSSGHVHSSGSGSSGSSGHVNSSGGLGGGGSGSGSGCGGHVHSSGGAAAAAAAVSGGHAPSSSHAHSGGAGPSSEQGAAASSCSLVDMPAATRLVTWPGSFTHTEQLGRLALPPHLHAWLPHVTDLALWHLGVVLHLPEYQMFNPVPVSTTAKQTQLPHVLPLLRALPALRVLRLWLRQPPADPCTTPSWDSYCPWEYSAQVAAELLVALAPHLAHMPQLKLIEVDSSCLEALGDGEERQLPQFAGLPFLTAFLLGLSGSRSLVCVRLMPPGVDPHRVRHRWSETLAAGHSAAAMQQLRSHIGMAEVMRPLPFAVAIVDG